MKSTSLRISAFVIAAVVFGITVTAIVQAHGAGWDSEATSASQRVLQKFDFTDAPLVNVANLEELYTAVNNAANAGSQVVLAPGTYLLSATNSAGVARPNGGRLELQENMSLLGVVGNRGAVVVDAANLPASSYTAPIPNTGAIRMGKGTNAVEWLTVRNALGGGAGIIVHLDSAGTASVRIAHCVATGGHRGIDIRNVAGGVGGFFIEAEIVDNDLHNNLISTAQGLRIAHAQGVSGNVINANLSGNRIYDNQQGLLVENLGSTNGGVVSVNSSGDRFFENGGGTTIGAALGPSSNNTVNFTAVGSFFENNNAPTGFYRGGLNVIGSVSFQVPSGGSDNTANVTLRNCQFANNQVADLNVFGASSLPVSIGPAGSNNRATVRIFNSLVPNIISADSSPANPGGMNRADVFRYVQLSGRVTTPAGQGMINTAVLMYDSQGGMRTATTSTTGYYTFEDVAAGESYLVTVRSRRYRFARRNIQVLDNLSDVDFVGLK